MCARAVAVVVAAYQKREGHKRTARERVGEGGSGTLKGIYQPKKWVGACCYTSVMIYDLHAVIVLKPILQCIYIYIQRYGGEGNRERPIIHI